MRDLSPTLLAAQQEGTGVPCVKVEALNRFAGAVRCTWERLYEGNEDDYFHSLSLAGNGSMIRVRISSVLDNRKLYVQRVTEPGPESDFSTWTYFNEAGCCAVTVVSAGSEVSIFIINVYGELRLIRSTDYGENWENTHTIDYFPSTAVSGFSAVAKPDGDLALFASISDLVYAKERRGGGWRVKSAWDKNTGILSGVAAAYGNDWNLVVTGKDSDDTNKVWSLIYGDGGEIPSEEWSELREICSAASDGEFEFKHVFMDKPDEIRCYYIEKYTGVESYSIPYRTQSVAGTDYAGNQWLEPVPFNLQCEYGIAIAHYGQYCWLSIPGGVWRADATELTYDLSGDVVYLRQDTEENTESLVIELRNDDGRYAELPSLLTTGCELRIAPGYRTGQGEEYSSGLSFILESFEYVSKGGTCSLFLYAVGGRARINSWVSGSQFRFNNTTGIDSVLQILEFVLSKAGLKLEVISASSLVTDYYPDFTIYAGSSGASVLRNLLSFVPDRLFVEGDTAYLLNPLSSDEPVYSYGLTHPVIEGNYKTSAWKLNKVTIEGYDYDLEQKILKESFSWDQIEARQLRVERIEDRNINSVEGASERGEVYLKSAESESVNGTITVPVNCGQQAFDMIDVTDSRVGLSSEKKRVTGISLIYDPGKGEYVQKLSLGAPV